MSGELREIFQGLRFLEGVTPNVELEEAERVLKRISALPGGKVHATLHLSALRGVAQEKIVWRRGEFALIDVTEAPVYHAPFGDAFRRELLGLLGLP